MGFEEVVTLILMLILLLCSIVAYIFLSGKILPDALFKRRYRCDGCSDRGLRRFVFPEGRGVSYEPHPSMRKYVPTYILFTNDGYKYIKCKTDSRVQSLEYDVLLFNNKNRLFDVVSVSERLAESERTAEVMLHEDTSYVSFKLKSVNGKSVNSEASVYYRFRDAVKYCLASIAVTFVEMLIMKTTVNEIIRSLTDAPDSFRLGAGIVFGASLVIGALSSLFVMRLKCTKGVRVVWHDIK